VADPLRWCRAAACATSAAVLLASGISWYAYHELRSGMTTSDALARLGGRSPQRLDNAVDILLIGLDSRRDMNGRDLPKWFVADDLHAGSSEIGGYNTNTLILLRIPAGGGKAQAYSIPRDDWVETFNGDGTSQGMHKIKEAYGLAKAVAEQRLRASGVVGAALERQSREAGREATIATVQRFLDLPVDHFAEVNLLGFYDIAKVVQPVTVCLKHATRDPAVDGKGSGADFHAGLNVLNASQALSFVRQRHNLAMGDLDRTERQQAFLSSVVHKLRADGVWGDVGRMRGLLDVVRRDVVLDSGWNVLDFMAQAPDLTGANVEFHTLPVQGFAMRNGQSVNVVDPAEVRALVRGGAAAASPSPSAAVAVAGGKVPPAVVDVLNGSGVQGAAAAESAALAGMGWTPGAVGNAPQAAETSVRYGQGADGAAERIAGRLGVRAVGNAAVPAGRVVVVLGGVSSPPTHPQTSHAPHFYGTPVRMDGIPCVE
jgi:LCP family protein required for cell wall assembly